MIKKGLFLFGAATFMAASFASATYQSDIQIALTLKESEWTDKILKNGDEEWTGKIITYRVTNRDLLEELKEEGVIDSVKGWKIVSIRNSEWEEDICVTHKTQGTILIQEGGFVNWDDVVAESYVESGREVYNDEEGVKSATFKFEDTFTVLDSELAGLPFTGTLKAVGSEGLVRAKGGDTNWLMNAVKVRLLGSSDDDVGVEGTVSFSKEKFVPAL